MAQEIIENINVSTIMYSLHLLPSLMHLGVLFIEQVCLHLSIWEGPCRSRCFYQISLNREHSRFGLYWVIKHCNLSSTFLSLFLRVIMDDAKKQKFIMCNQCKISIYTFHPTPLKLGFWEQTR